MRALDTHIMISYISRISNIAPTNDDELASASEAVASPPDVPIELCSEAKDNGDHQCDDVKITCSPQEKQDFEFDNDRKINNSNKTLVEELVRSRLL